MADSMSKNHGNITCKKCTKQKRRSAMKNASMCKDCDNEAKKKKYQASSSSSSASASVFSSPSFSSSSSSSSPALLLQLADFALADDEKLSNSSNDPPAKRSSESSHAFLQAEEELKSLTSHSTSASSCSSQPDPFNSTIISTHDFCFVQSTEAAAKLADKWLAIEDFVTDYAFQGNLTATGSGRQIDLIELTKQVISVQQQKNRSFKAKAVTLQILLEETKSYIYTHIAPLIIQSFLAANNSDSSINIPTLKLVLYDQKKEEQKVHADQDKDKNGVRKWSVIMHLMCNRCSYTALFPANYHERAAKLKIWLDQQKESEKDAARLKALDNKADQDKHEGKEEKNKKGKEEKVHSVSSTKDELNKSTASTSSSSAATAASASVHVAASESLPESLSSLSRQKTDGFSLTSLFFECQTPSCGGVQCLRCDKFLNSADEKLSHLCNVSAMKILHERFTQVLADANTMRCPCCGWVGHKDTACSHMFCEACRNYWCYMCGQQVDPNDEYGGWSVHNSWNFVKQTPGHCPMYLHYRFGGGAINAQHLFTSGDPDESLRLFHIFHVQRAMEQFRAGLSLQEKAMFIEMLELDFPDGVIDENDLKRLAEIDKQIEDHCEQFRKSEEKKKEEEERKKREEDERKLKEVQQQQENKLKAEQDKKEANTKEEEEKKRDPQ